MLVLECFGLHFINEEQSEAVKIDKCIINHAVTELEIECLAEQLPEFLTVDLAKELGAGVLVRGVRNSSDFLYEQQIAQLNRDLAPDLPTVLFMAEAANSALASSMLKEIAMLCPVSSWNLLIWFR